MEHKIIIAGIGPGGEEFISPAARRAIGSAEILVGGRRALAQFSSETQITFPITADIRAAVEFIRSSLAQADVVVMVSGDPGYYSMLDVLRREFDPNLLEVIPSIGALQLAFARAKLPWHSATLLSFHGRRPPDEELFYRKGRVLGLLTDGKFNSHTIPEILLRNNWTPSSRLLIFSKLSYVDEKIIETSLAEAKNFPVEKNCVLIVGSDDDDR